MLPLAIFLPVMIGTPLLLLSKRIGHMLDAMPATWLVAVQLYRVFGSWALAAWLRDALPGVFALPTADVVSHVGGPEGVVAALTTVGRAMSTGELVAATGKPRSAVDAALHRLRESGAIVTIRRGLFALAPKAAAG